MQVRQIKRKLTTIGRSFVLMRLLQQYSGRGSNTLFNDLNNPECRLPMKKRGTWQK